MPVITLFSGSYCNEKEVVKEIGARTGYQPVSDQEIVAEASQLSRIPENRIERVFTDKTSVFNRLTHERERSLAYLRATLAKRLSEEGLLISGFASQLIPRNISHVLRVCLIADMNARVATAVDVLKVGQAEALKTIHRDDEKAAAWMHALHGAKDPWSAELYDICLPTDKTSSRQIADLVERGISASAIKLASGARQAVDDFKIAANVEIALAKKGHSVDVEVKDGVVTLTINKHVLMLGRLEEELKEIAIRESGVKAVETKVGPGYYQTDVYRRQDFAAPSKILLVDDEKKYVQTLSKRLMMRELDSAVVYDGESALELAQDDEPDVMILDLRMPGIDGIEVLRRVKQTRPQIEVIVLTSQGSEEDRKTCMELGAFAFLSKSVDIDELSQTIKAAHEKIQQERQQP
ncbi:Response regulator receiver domain protein [Desulfosarcina cetonica]|uniref:response regulator n=1 Tax=Desulfosarcina cetonica TaxID=90730 RepID=UPI0006CFECE1|nr:response regulator [Desulfosarcina cetonica]VTR70987.1 Response regulator receiver domain protein [Desulfosarcina cetonica]